MTVAQRVTNLSPRDKNIDRVRCLQLRVEAMNGQDQTGVLWSAVESAHRINYLELLAVFLALKSFEKDLSHCTVLVKSDNILAVTYINQKKGCSLQIAEPFDNRNLRVASDLQDHLSGRTSSWDTQHD